MKYYKTLKNGKIVSVFCCNQPQTFGTEISKEEYDLLTPKENWQSDMDDDENCVSTSIKDMQNALNILGVN